MVGGWLDHMNRLVFSNLNDSLVLWLAFCCLPCVICWSIVSDLTCTLVCKLLNRWTMVPPWQWRDCIPLAEGFCWRPAWQSWAWMVLRWSSHWLSHSVKTVEFNNKESEEAMGSSGWKLGPCRKSPPLSCFSSQLLLILKRGINIFCQY